jgi:hypothetical protein
MVKEFKWENLSPLHKMNSAIQMAAYHYITSVKAKAGNENCELTVESNNYSFENIRRHDNKTLIWEYQCWVARCVLRDLVESFSIFMVDVYRTALANSSGGMSTSIVEFEKMGVERQSQVFKNDFNIDNRWLVMFDGFNRARNCLAHRQGVVSSKDASENGALVMTWLKINWLVAERAPTEFVEASGPYRGLIQGRQETGSFAVDIQVESVEKRVAIGTILVFGPDEILQICMTFQTLASVFSRVAR